MWPMYADPVGHAGVPDDDPRAWTGSSFPSAEARAGASTPMYRQIYVRLRSQILSGQLEAGTRLPSTRILAAELGMSRTTTALAYELLVLGGYVESHVGPGTRVAPPGPRHQPAAPPRPLPPAPGAPPPRLTRPLPLLRR